MNWLRIMDKVNNKKLSFFDLHVHVAPDTYLRRYTANSLGKELKETLSGAVIKSHLIATTGIEHMMYELGLNIYGSITLNKYSGGINKDVVKSAIAASKNDKMIIYFPTITDKKVNIKMKQGKTHDILNRYLNEGETVSYDGSLKEEAKEIIKMASYYDIPIATGHSSKEEVFLIGDEVIKNKGKLILTHPFHPIVNLNFQEVKDLIGCDNIYAEFTILMSLLKYRNMEYLLPLLRAGYEDKIFVSSDLGQVSNCTVTEGYISFEAVMRENYIEDDVIRKIILKNPKKIINIK